MIENSTPSPKYNKPPVIEVAIGVIFEKIKGLKMPYFGLFWEEVREEFPNCEHASPLVASIDNEMIDSDIGFLLPRIWFVNKAKDRLMQLQNDRFYFNWRATEKNLKYPSFEENFKEFNKLLRLFTEFLQKQNFEMLNIYDCELSYINHIPEGTGWDSLADTSIIFPDITWQRGDQGFLKNPDNLLTQLKFDFPENKGGLTVKLHQGRRKTDSLPILILEMIARGLGEDKSEAGINKWFELAHEWIVRGFADLTDMKIQKESWDRYV